MKICSKCVLPETFPGIYFNEDGLCNYCRQSSQDLHLEIRKAEILSRFEELVGEVRGRSGYQCLLAFSGGKDSTYTLKLLREKFHLRVLAVTLDNGFPSPHTVMNIRQVTERLDVDHLWIKPRTDLLRKLYQGLSENKSLPLTDLTRAGGVCYACIGIVKNMVLRLAIEQQIPMVAYGWSPGEAPVDASLIQMTPLFLEQMLTRRQQPLVSIAGDELTAYMPSLEQIRSMAQPIHNVHPMAFLPYDEKVLMEDIRRIGWTAPSDTGDRSRDGTLDLYGIRRHMEYGFHPYVAEIAHLVRNRYLTREEGLRKLADNGSPWMEEELGRNLRERESEPPAGKEIGIRCA